MSRILQNIVPAILAVICTASYAACSCAHRGDLCVEALELEAKVVIKGLTNLTDSTDLVFLKSFSYNTEAGDEFMPESAGSSDWSIPSDMKWVDMHVGDDINGYDVDVRLYPDEGYPDVGYAVYRFRAGDREMTVDTGYYWPWYLHAEGKTAGCSSLEVVNPFEDLVQGEEAEIAECLFCFKDVDFDGEKELCFRSKGYNREYYQICKVIGERIIPMVKGPYGNIVYGLCGDTKFDYSEKTVTIDEEFGLSSRWTKVFSRRKDAEDPLDPMVLSSGMETDYMCAGVISRVEYSDGKAVSETLEYSSVSDVDYLTVKYLISDDDVCYLNAISYHKDGKDMQIYSGRQMPDCSGGALVEPYAFKSVR